MSWRLERESTLVAARGESCEKNTAKSLAVATSPLAGASAPVE